jgi:plastocyanin domain-containing protein
MVEKPAPSTTQAAAQPAAKATKEVAIKVGEDGFEPNEVKVSKGEETSLVFTRMSDKTCAKEVEFPELKVKKELPLNQPVAVVVPSSEARTITFQCGMGMYKSKVVVQ